MASHPNTNADPITTRRLGAARRAASSAPLSDPIAITLASSPYSPAPLWKTSRAISAVVIACRAGASIAAATPNSEART